MKTILLLANNDVGVYLFRKEIIEDLVREGYKIYVALPKGNLISKIQELGCYYIQTPIDRRKTNPFKDAKLFLQYINILKRIKPQLVLCYTAKPMVYGGIACSLLGIPYISYIEGVGTTFNGNALKVKVIEMLFKIGLHHCQEIIFMNEANKKLFQEKGILKGQKYDYIRSTGINLGNFEYKDYPVEEKKIVFTFIARILKEKGIEIFIETAKAIKNKYPDTVFQVVGAIEEQKEYEEILDKLQQQGVIQYLGHQENIANILANTHCVLFPSYYGEGRNVVLQEACAVGRPIITTDAVGCYESVEEGVNGYVVPQKNTVAFIRATEHFILQGPKIWRQMGQKAREKAEKEMNRKYYANMWMEKIKQYIE